MKIRHVHDRFSNDGDFKRYPGQHGDRRKQTPQPTLSWEKIGIAKPVLVLVRNVMSSSQDKRRLSMVTYRLQPS